MHGNCVTLYLIWAWFLLCAIGSRSGMFVCGLVSGVGM